MFEIHLWNKFTSIYSQNAKVSVGALAMTRVYDLISYDYKHNEDYTIKNEIVVVLA